MLIPLPSTNRNIILPASVADKDTETRLRRYTDWMDLNGRHWTRPDLAEYRDYLLDQGLAPVSIAAYLATVRSRYRDLLRQRDLFYNLAPPIDDALDEISQATLLTARKAMVDEIIQRLEHAIHPDTAPVELTTHQDRPDSQFIRLSAAQAERLIKAPGTATLKGLRDTALIALLLCTGLREQELVDLEIPDHDERFSDQPAVYVRHGKGDKARLVPYGELDWVLVLINRWLNTAEITEGPIFRGVTRHGAVRDTALTTRAVQQIVESYPIVINGELRPIPPHNLRRTYARRSYEAGQDPVAIQQNMGHSSLEQTMEYIGALDVTRRRPPSIYNIDIAELVDLHSDL